MCVVIAITKKKNYCQKCAVCHCAPTDKKGSRNIEITEKVTKLQVGLASRFLPQLNQRDVSSQAAFPNGPQSGPTGAQPGPNLAQLGPNRGPHVMLLGIAGHLTPAVEDRIDAVERSMREMGTMLKQVLTEMKKTPICRFVDLWVSLISGSDEGD